MVTSNNQPLISIIIPFYNSENYIKRCITSLFQQTISNCIEYIFINDCSTDNSRKIIEEILSTYPKLHNNVKIINNTSNMGQSFSRKVGIQHATGKFISFCDSDDWLDITMYEELYNYALNTNADIVYCDFYIISTNKTIPVNNNSTCIIKDILFSKVAGCLWNKLFKRDLFDNSLLWCKTNMGEDMVLSIQLILKAKNIQYLNKYLYYYYINNNSTVMLQDEQGISQRFYGMYESTEVLSKLLLNINYNEYSEAIFFRKLLTKLMLLPIVHKRNWYLQFKNTYPDISIYSVCKAQIPNRYKISFILTYLRVSPYLKKLKTRL